MNQIRNLRQKAGIDMADLANLANADIAEIALAENGIGHVRFDTAEMIAAALDASLSALFPDAEEILDALPDDEDPNYRDTLLTPENADTLLAAGLDPDILPWFAILKMKSGNEQKYLLTSFEKDQIVAALREPSGKFVRFVADCRHVAVKLDAVADVKLTNMTSYAPFSSHDSAFEVTVLWTNGARPERIEVHPDESKFGLASVVASDRKEEMPAFISLVTDEGDERFIATDAIDVIEIPVGVLMPNIYHDGKASQACSRTDDISELEPAGNA